MTDKKDIVPFTIKEQRLIEGLAKRRDSAEAKFPLTTALLVTFGVVSVFYGFEKIIDKIDFLSRNPIILLLIGLTTLVVTGAVHKKLS
jgi:hypothetical protein